MISFVVYGKPQPAGSKRAFKHPSTGRIVVTDDAKGSRPWKQEIAGAALEAMAGRDPFTGPVWVDLYFCVARPKSHYGAGRNADKVRPSAPRYPAVKPDVDKLSRAVMDALTGTVIKDDALVVGKYASKHYGLPERVVIHVCEAP